MAATSRLDAVNTMLAATGGSPVNTLTDGFIDVQNATAILARVTKEILSEGMNFNTDLAQSFSVDTNGQVILPITTLKADGSQDYNEKFNLIQRGFKMYDRRGHSFDLRFADPSVSEVFLDITTELDWDDIPQIVRTFIVARASVQYEVSYQGSDSTSQKLMAFEKQARLAVIQWDSESEDANFFDELYTNFTLFRG
jgi:hypothetical protein